MKDIDYLKIKNDILMAACDEIKEILIRDAKGKTFKDTEAVDILNKIVTVINVTDRNLESLNTK